MKDVRSMAVLVFFICSCEASAQSEAQTVAGRIAFLREDAVWLARPDGTGAEKVTGEGVIVDDFRFSPSRRYLAYSAVVGSAEEPGIWDSTETAPERPVCSIVVLDLATKSTVHRTDSAWVYLARWLPGDTLLYYDSDGFAINLYYAFHPPTGSVRTIEIPDMRLTDSEFSRDGSLEAYTGEDGIRPHLYTLHLYNRTTGRDTVIISKKGTISDICFSRDTGRIVFLEVESINQKYFDILWLFDRTTSVCTSLDRRPARAKYRGEKNVAWSPGDRHIGMFYPPQALVFDVQNPSETRTITGRDFCWIAGDQLIFGKDHDTYRYDLPTRTQRVLLPNAVKAVFLQ